MPAAGDAARGIAADEVELQLEAIAGGVELDGLQRLAGVGVGELGTLGGILQGRLEIDRRRRRGRQILERQRRVPLRRVGAVEDQRLELQLGARRRFARREEVAAAPLDLGGELRQVRLRRDLRLDADLGVLALAIGEGERRLADRHVAAGGDDVPVGLLDGGDGLRDDAAQRRLRSIDAGAGDADRAARRIDRPALEQRLAQLDAERGEPRRRDQREEVVGDVAGDRGGRRQRRAAVEQPREAGGAGDAAPRGRQLAGRRAGQDRNRRQLLVAVAGVAADDGIERRLRAGDAFAALRDRLALDDDVAVLGEGRGDGVLEGQRLRRRGRRQQPAQRRDEDPKAPHASIIYAVEPRPG